MANPTVKSTFGIMTNPAIRRLEKVATGQLSDNVASYSGVVFKTICFLIWTVVGIAAFFIANKYLITLMPETFMTVESENAFEFTFTLPSICVVGIALLLTVVMAIVCIFVRRGIAVTGSIYCVAEGYLLAFLTGSLSSEYEWLGYLALALTVVIVLTLLLLYKSRKIKVGQKFRSTVTTLFIVVILSGIAIFIFSFIPGLSNISNAIYEIRSNPVVAMVMSAAFAFLACLFLVSDFDAVKQLVENKLPKKYEWNCAFGIAYTVLYLYIKLLELLVNAFGRNK